MSSKEPLGNSESTSPPNKTKSSPTPDSVETDGSKPSPKDTMSRLTTDSVEKSRPTSTPKDTKNQPTTDSVGLIRSVTTLNDTKNRPTTDSVGLIRSVTTLNDTKNRPTTDAVGLIRSVTTLNDTKNRPTTDAVGLIRSVTTLNDTKNRPTTDAVGLSRSVATLNSTKSGHIADSVKKKNIGSTPTTDDTKDEPIKDGGVEAMGLTFTPNSTMGSPNKDSVLNIGSTTSLKTKSAIAGDVCRVFGVFFAIGVRLVLLTFCLFTVGLVVSQLDQEIYWLLSMLSIFLILETVQIVVTRGGQERKWVCACFICYLFACVPSIWILELHRLDLYQSKTENTSTQLSVGVSGLSADVKLDPSLILSITEQGLLFLIILARWFLPRGEITRNQLSQLLFVFIGMASDVMELFELFDESEVRNDLPLTLGILTVWTVSLFQFCLVLTMSRSVKKKRVVFAENIGEDKGLLHELLKTELWSLFISIFMQDGPFLVIRLYALVTYNLVNYSILFFTCKNILVIMLLFYRLLILILEKYEQSKDDDDDDDDEEDDSKTITTTTGSSSPGTTKLRRRNQVDPKDCSDA